MKTRIKYILLALIILGFLVWYFYNLITDERFLSTAGWIFLIFSAFMFGWWYGLEKSYCSDKEEHEDRLKNGY